MKNNKAISGIAFMLSIAALVLSGIVSIFKIDLWLAGTQWILISIIFGVYAIYAKDCDLSCTCCEKKQ